MSTFCSRPEPDGSGAFAEIVSVLADPPEEVDLGSGFHLLVAEVRNNLGSSSIICEFGVFST